MNKVREALRRGAGDPLGVATDPELSFAVVDAAARRFIMVDHSDEALRAWRDVVAEVLSESVGGDSPDGRTQRAAREFLLHACEEWAAGGRAGTPSDYLREVVAAPDPEQGIVLAHTATILFDMAWGTDPAVARVG